MPPITGPGNNIALEVDANAIDVLVLHTQALAPNFLYFSP
jgi:hypothetical protein